MLQIPRFSRLDPLSAVEQARVALSMLNFFSPLSNKKMCEELGKPTRKDRTIPLCMGDFLRWSKNNGKDLYNRMSHIQVIAKRLIAQHMLENAGTSEGSPGFYECYYSPIELTEREKRGFLFLGRSLGLQLVAELIPPLLAFVQGKNENGDVNCGTGILVAPGIVITCAHVVKDMRLDGEIWIGDTLCPIVGTVAHDEIDIAVIKIDSSITPIVRDVVFSDTAILEKVLVAGYPKIPRAQIPVPVLQTGEICGLSLMTTDKKKLILFSAIARPGNSGGPIITADGRIVGIASEILERSREQLDSAKGAPENDIGEECSQNLPPPLPFFGAVPANEVRRAVSEIDSEIIIPWEDYQ
jgi:hypothetical protein